MSLPPDEAKRERIRAVARDMLKLGQVPRIVPIRERTGSGTCTVREVLVEMRDSGEFQAITARHKARKRSERLATKRRRRMSGKRHDEETIELVRQTILRMSQGDEMPSCANIAAEVEMPRSFVQRVRARMVKSGALDRAHVRVIAPPLGDAEHGLIRAAFLRDPGMSVYCVARALGFSNGPCREIRAEMLAAGEVGPVRPRMSREDTLADLRESRGLPPRKPPDREKPPRPHRAAPVDRGEYERVELPAPRREMPDPRPHPWYTPDDMAKWLPVARRAILGVVGGYPTLPIPSEEQQTRMPSPRRPKPLPLRPLKSRLLYPEECQP